MLLKPVSVFLFVCYSEKIPLLLWAYFNWDYFFLFAEKYRIKFELYNQRKLLEPQDMATERQYLELSLNRKTDFI